MNNGYGTNFRAPNVDVHNFAMAPSPEIPRSRYKMPQINKTTFQASYLIPIYIQELVPGDSIHGSMTAFCRLATPIYPIMDPMDLETFFFAVPMRILWTHFVNFMGEQVNPADSISYTIPTVGSAAGGFPRDTIYDYFGLPTVGQTGAGNAIHVNALPFRAYNQIWNQWFRDQNLQQSAAIDLSDGPDSNNDYALLQVNKRHDYFTSCLPWTQKGASAVLPLQGTALVRTSATSGVSGAQSPMLYLTAAGGVSPGASVVAGIGTGNQAAAGTAALVGGPNPFYPSNLYADLSTATQTTINALRLAFATQQFLERDARGGTRYVEGVLSHFKVRVPDYRAQRPEYIGGGKTSVTISPVPQTGGTGASGTTTPIGTLSAAGTALARHGFSYQATEHCYIIGLATVRRDNTYQNGIRRLWTRSTRYDFYTPEFANLGEQAVRNDEIYSDGSANDPLPFGYQERFAEMRYAPSYTCSYFRSTHTTPLDSWHLAENFTSLPTLSTTWIQDTTGATLQRAVAAGAAATNQQILADLFFDVTAARPIPMYSVPGLTRF